MTLVVVACCRPKLDRPAPARALYTGSTFRMALAAAESGYLGPDTRVAIMSALHGLVDPATVLAPYDVTIDDPFRAIGPGALAMTAGPFDVGPGTVVHTMLPKAYLAVLRVSVGALGGRIVDEFAGCRGIGDQRARLRDIRESVTA